MYTPLEEAEKELWSRWNNPVLRREVQQFIGELPVVFEEKPRAVLFRNIMTPNFEYLKFLESAKKINLSPLGLEYVTDRFCTRNMDKVSLGRLPIFQKKDKNDRDVIQYNRILDLMGCENRQINEIKTLWGEQLIDFHHRLLPLHSEGIELFDISLWHKFNGNSAKHYYPYYLAFFICHGILFENFITNDEEKAFAQSVVAPAIEKVREHFGLKPLIVLLGDESEQSSKYWICYHSNIKQEVLQCQALLLKDE
ncbi:MAG: hypothetical protein HZB31_06135 [Nitrospirae bacterium]|nr:hypothetical protein [Nitrospirota bacterium]